MPLKTLVTLLRVVRDQGYPVDLALQQIGLDFNPLERDAASTPAQVPTECYSKLYGLLMEILQDEAFGLGQENHAPPGTFRMMCLFIIHCATLEQALIRAREFHDYCDQFRQPEGGKRSGPPVMDLEHPDQVLCLFERSNDPEDDRAYIGHANVLLMMYRFYSWLIGRELPLLEVHLRAEAPPETGAYEAIFGCPVRFAMPHSGPA